MNAARLSTIVDRIQCPRCQRTSGTVDAEEFRGTWTCYRNDCAQHWWVMLLNAGDVEQQLSDAFGFELTTDLMQRYHLPRTLETRKFWQLSLTRTQFEENNGRGSHRLLAIISQTLKTRISLVPSRNKP